MIALAYRGRNVRYGIGLRSVIHLRVSYEAAPVLCTISEDRNSFDAVSCVRQRQTCVYRRLVHPYGPPATKGGINPNEADALKS